jgi:hypothetical protein
METNSGASSLVVAIVITIVLACATAMRAGSARVTVALMVFVASLAPAFTDEGFPIRTWLFPLQEHRSEIYVALAMGLLIGLAPYLRSVSLRLAGPQATILLLIGLYQGALRMHHDDVSVGLATIAFSLCTVGAIAVALPTLLDRPRSWYLVLMAPLGANILWIGAVMVQARVDPQQLILGGRFTGVTSNPQSAAIVLCLGSALALWMAMYDPQGWHRGVWLILFAVDLILLIWTGSRTGALGFMIGAMAILRRRLGTKVLWIGGGLLLTYLLSGWFMDRGLEDAAVRLASMHDSGRSDALARMIDTGIAHPLLGDGIYDAGASENSYILAFAAFGIGMVVLVVLLVGVSARECLRVARGAKRYRGLSGFGDLIIAFNLMYFTIAMFEGIILARVREALVWMIVFSALSAAVKRASVGARGAVRRGRPGVLGHWRSTRWSHRQRVSGVLPRYAGAGALGNGRRLGG